MSPQVNERAYGKKCKNIFFNRIFKINSYIKGSKWRPAVFCGSLPPQQWRIPGLRVEDTASRYGE